jgi:thiol:disulfide interchange protein
VGMLAGALLWAAQPAPVAPWERFSRQTLTGMLGQETVLVDFTADWCPTCKVLEQTNLTPARLTALKARYNIRLLRADLTEKNPEAEELLHSLGSKSIPLLAIFPKNSPDSPLVLRDLFTPSQLEDAVRQSTAK